MDYLEGLFGVDTFTQIAATSTAGQYLKYMQGIYRAHLQNNSRYKHPCMIPKREWKSLIEDVKKKKLRKEGKAPPSPAR